MKTPSRSYLFVPGLVSALALVATTPSFPQHRDETANGTGQLAQYCLPKDDASPDAPRLYC
ncbi:MAG TPA: hypothetical protein VFP43_07510 [Mesorhizobium sp.]|nr:hypothetical protein [Mesorhizobium sp.]